MSMEHLESKWLVDKDDDGQYCIITDEPEPWHIAGACECLPGDESGRKALRHICEAHNESLVDA